MIWLTGRTILRLGEFFFSNQLTGTAFATRPDSLRNLRKIDFELARGPSQNWQRTRKEISMTELFVF